MPLLAGDICIARNTQCVTKCGPHKYETDNKGVRAFQVLQTKQGFVQVKELRAGDISWNRAADLNPMPRSLKPEDPCEESIMLPEKRSGTDTFNVVPAMPDGACVFRSFHIAQQVQAGVGASMVVDSTEAAFVLRKDLLQYMPVLLESCDADRLAFVQEEVAREMLDDPAWMEGPGLASWKWENYFNYTLNPRAYGTAMLQMYADKYLCAQLWSMTSMVLVSSN